jgi:hypothetical protein
MLEQKGNRALVLRFGEGCRLEDCKGFELLDRLRVKILVDGGKWAFMGVCVWDVWTYSGVKSGITRWILGVLGCMKKACHGRGRGGVFFTVKRARG